MLFNNYLGKYVHRTRYLRPFSLPSAGLLISSRASSPGYCWAGSDPKIQGRRVCTLQYSFYSGFELRSSCRCLITPGIFAGNLAAVITTDMTAARHPSVAGALLMKAFYSQLTL